MTLFRHDGAGSRLWGLSRMALARPGLARLPGLRFWKLCGAGSGHGFSFRPDGRVWAILAVWEDLKAAEQGLQSPIWTRWRARAAESLSILMRPLTARGSWSGAQPFPPEPGPSHGPFAVLTRATVKPRALTAFWARVPEVNDRIGANPDVLFKIGIGEVPLLHQVTFSVWPDMAAMARFAHAPGPHAEAVTQVRQGDWFSEELYARFQVLGTQGQWSGMPPLTQPERIVA
ncbi:spheroidene monooxygenase [Stagnihabitans tardus]|uniref:spheroidene monooxygenase n=1 Tax=Stagnihabitans tardus TaxID=2699202 RepID=UPI00338D4990